ncbi:MAG: putative quinol monooxygenase [Myxococcota bacterium]|nr:putative quinol monooxygenase [Myxococcota bacterium]
MIILTGWVDVDPERRDAALEAGRPHMEATRAWPGCLDYVWSGDPLNPARIYVYERWESEEALARHFEGPHYTAMRDTIGAHGIRGVEVFKYEPARQGAVYDAKGVARADFFEEA